MPASFICPRLYAHFYVDTYVRKIPCRIPESSIVLKRKKWRHCRGWRFSRGEGVAVLCACTWQICSFVHAYGFVKKFLWSRLKHFYIYNRYIRYNVCYNVGVVRVSLSQEARLIFAIWLSDILAMFSCVRTTYHWLLRDSTSHCCSQTLGRPKKHIMCYILKIKYRISVETNKLYIQAYWSKPIILWSCRS